MVDIPNMEIMQKLEEDLKGEYNLESRLGRYESMNPELIEFAQGEGIEKASDASHALFLADFVVTASEVPQGIDDDQRRKIIINIFKKLLPHTEDTENITKLFYIAYNLAVQIRRTNAFLAGRGIETSTRKHILIMTYLVQFVQHTGELIEDEGCSAELSILFAALKNTDPSSEFDDIKEGLNLDNPEFMNEISRKMDEFMKSQEVEVNDTVVLPYMDSSQLLYVSTDFKDPALSGYGLKTGSTKESINYVKDMMSYFDQKGEDRKFLYLRGSIIGEDSNIILVKHPSYNTAIIMKTTAEEANVTELLALMELQGSLDKSWMSSSMTVPIVEGKNEMVTEEVEELVDTVVEEDVETPVERQEEKKGFFSRIKSLFGSSATPEPATRTEKVQRTVTEKRKKKVHRQLRREETLGTSFSEDVIRSMGILSLSDLRLYEIFDTIREAEYVVTGAIYSDFEKDTTQFVVTELLEDPKNLADNLDGLDEVIEKVVSHYFSPDIQILPKEIIFMGENGRFLISMDGDSEKIVGTIAQTYKVEFTDWQKRANKDEKLQRRSLHMRTGQLLSSLMHTPFDRSVERIHHLNESNSNLIELDRAFMKLV